jgi:hypothetical protein
MSSLNLDTNTAIALIAENSTVRYGLREFIGASEMVMAQTAFNEFWNIVRGSAGENEQDRATRFRQKIIIVPDNPSPRFQALQPTKNLDINDIIILGTGDQLGIITMTADAKAVRAARAQGVDFLVYLHSPYPLTGH